MNLFLWLVGLILIAAATVPLIRSHRRAKWVATASRYLFRLNVAIPEQSKEMQDAFMADAFAAYRNNQSDSAARATAIKFFREHAVDDPKLTLSDKVHEKPWIAAVETLGRWGVEDSRVSLQVKMTLNSIKSLQSRLRAKEESAA